MPTDSDFRRSNRYRAISFRPEAEAFDAFGSLLAFDDAETRERSSTALYRALSYTVGVSSPRVLVLDAPRPHRVRDGRTVYQRLGSYSRRTHTVRVHNRTARIGRLVAPKTFAETILHELLHHWDFELLNLDRSLHTSGFYHRLGDLKRKLNAGLAGPIGG
jgi:hypothetical protein